MTNPSPHRVARKDVCRFCGQEVATETYVKWLRKNKFPQLAKALEMVSRRSSITKKGTKRKTK